MELYVFGLAVVLIMTVIIIQVIYCSCYWFYPLPGQGESSFQKFTNGKLQKKKNHKRNRGDEYSLDDIEKRPATPSSDTARLTPSSLDTSAATKGETDV